ncbi:hypothetical protein ACF0H5_001866 [Mactra antiquata]
MIDVVGYGQFSRPLPGMHDNNGMSASHGTRMSPGNGFQTLHPVAHEIHHTSVIKKLDHSVESFVPSSHHHTHNPGNHANDLNNDAMLDDDFSDHDSHYSEDLEDIDIDLEPKKDMTKQLLDFASVVSSDIQKFFGRKKGEDDSCDIYEDKWTSTKSGRELYYADLMKIVHGEDKGNSKAGKSSPLLDISNSVSEVKDNRSSFTGKPDKKIGVGPLNELFEYGLRHFMADKKLKNNKEIKRLKPESKKFQSVTPMHTRKLPTSFWKEPGSQASNVAESRQSSNSTVLQSNNPPDFSDLLESWRLDRNEFNGDVTSSSEVSMSPESV